MAPLAPTAESKKTSTMGLEAGSAFHAEVVQAFPIVPKKERYSMGLPIVGGLISSVVGILTGTAYGIAPQLPALLRSLGVPV